MLTELLLFLPLCLLGYFKVISVKYVLLTILFIYWIPKWFFIKLLNTTHPNIITHNKHIEKTVSLTFDDMPYGYHTEIIELLNKYNMKGTFFVISSQITANNIDIFVNAVKLGHQLANHGKTNSMHALKDTTALQQEIDHCDKVIRQIYELAQIPPPINMYYRPGCGAFTNNMLKVVKERDYKLALGSVYPNDPMIPSGTLNYYYLINHIEHGDVVILHDRKWTISLLKKLLPWMHNNNFTSVTLDGLFV